MRNSIVYFCLLVCCITVRAEELKLWYSHPAEEWVEALPLGNSRLGAMIYGNPFEEEIQLNEETVWGGSPYRNDNPEAYGVLSEVRKLIFAGREITAEKLWKEQKKTYDNEYVDNENVGDAYTNLEISSAEANLESRYKQSTQMKLAPVATELLGYYMDGDNSKHGITNIEYTEHGLRVVEFGETSVLNKVLRNDKPINMRFIKDTLNYAGKSPIITSADSYSFYTSGVDLALGLGSATAITSIKFEEGKILAKITVTDHYDFGKKEANAGDFLKSAYILQQSGRKKTFAYKTTYDVTYTIDEFLDYILKGIGD